jgi:hypothetical protein
MDGGHERKGDVDCKPCMDERREHMVAFKESLERKFEILFAKVDRVERRLFVDNGEKSIQTKIDRNTRILNVLIWVVGMIVTGCVMSTFTLVAWVIYHALTGQEPV